MNISKFPLLVQVRLKEFSPVETSAYFELYNRKRKSVFTAYLLLVFLGWHYIYLKKWQLQILHIVTFYGFFIWWLIDWFRVPSMVKGYNDDLAIELLKNFSHVKTSDKVSPYDIDYEAAITTSNNYDGSTTIYRILATTLIGIIVLIFFLTNPKQSQHERYLFENNKTAVQIKYYNYYLFSIAKSKQTKQVVSIGVLGRFF